MSEMDIIIIIYLFIITRVVKAVTDRGLFLRISMEVDCCLRLMMMSRKVVVAVVVAAVAVVVVVLQISSPPNSSN